MKFNIVAHRKVWYALSALLVISSIIFVAAIGLRFGIDFTGGTLIELSFAEPVETGVLRFALEQAGYRDITIQQTGEAGVLIRTEALDEQRHQDLLTAVQTVGSAEELRFDSIGPVIGKELRRTATLGIVITLLLIGIYVAWAFSKVSKPVESWKYAVLTIAAAFHDVIVTVGAFSLFGYFYGWEIDAAFVAALLTILGYSINDTVVIFDRTRENLLHHTGESFEQTVESSLHQTLMRSLNTGTGALLALIAIFAFGGESTRPFAMALIIGILVGTYSSIFFASPLLVTWESLKGRK